MNLAITLTAIYPLFASRIEKLAFTLHSYAEPSPRASEKPAHRINIQRDGTIR